MSGAMGKKRRANEPVETLLARDEEPQVATFTRPISTTLGALFVFGRGITGVFTLGALLLIWPQIAAEAGVAMSDRPIVLWIIICTVGIGILISFALAWLIWRGSNVARVIVMFGVTLSTIIAAVGYFANGETITLDTTLLSVAFDILVLLALSSRDARIWARSRHPKKR